MIGTSMQDGLRAELLDIREAAEFLRVSETSLRRWTNAGRLPCLRIGGRGEGPFPRADFLAVMGGAGAAAPPAPAPPRNPLFDLYTRHRRRARASAGLFGV